jgi:HlyD family secretion protein
MIGRRTFHWAAGLLSVCAFLVACESRSATREPSPEALQQSRPSKPADIGCAGRIEPENGLIRIAARDPSGGTAVIESVFIAEGQHVSKGQPVATLRGRTLAEAALKVSEQRVIVAERKLEQLKAAPKQAELASHTEEIERRQADYDRARLELARYEQLRKTEDVSASDLEIKRAYAEMAQRSLAEAQQDRSALAESRESDAAVLVSEIRAAEAEQARLTAEMQLYTILAPTSGQVLKVLVHNGESAGPNGVAEILEDGPLYAIAEVTESDIFKVKIGNKATVKGDLLPLTAEGVVESIGRLVAGSEVLTSDPSAFTDKRIIPVKIRLSGFEPARALIHARVAILIHT